MGADGSNDTHAVFYQVTAALLVGSDSNDAVVYEGLYGVSQGIDGLEQAVEDDRLESVQLQLACLSSHGDGHVISDDIEGNLVHYLRNNRVYLARHDGRTILLCRKVNLMEAGAGTGGHEAKVIGNLG